jgi:hypothetical protein
VILDRQHAAGETGRSGVRNNALWNCDGGGDGRVEEDELRADGGGGRKWVALSYVFHLCTLHSPVKEEGVRLESLVALGRESDPKGIGRDGLVVCGRCPVTVEDNTWHLESVRTRVWTR